MNIENIELHVKSREKSESETGEIFSLYASFTVDHMGKSLSGYAKICDLFNKSVDSSTYKVTITTITKLNTIDQKMIDGKIEEEATIIVNKFDGDSMTKSKLESVYHYPFCYPINKLKDSVFMAFK